MRAARPAAGPTLAAAEILAEAAEVIHPGLGFLHYRHIADPLISRERGQRVPEFRHTRVSNEKRPQVPWHPMEWSHIFC